MSFESIMYLPHHTSLTRPRMSRENRAGQFSAFAALTGHDEKIKETARLTNEMVEFTEDRISQLSWDIQKIEEKISEKPQVTFTCLKPDEKKSGGAFEMVTGNVRRIDYYNRVFVLTNGEEIPMDNVIEIVEENI